VIQVTPQMRIVVAVEAVDFRKGIDGFARLCREKLQSDPFRGTLFVFRNRRSTAIKVLFYDGQGFWLCHKRLSSGRFRAWPQGGSGGVHPLDAPRLQLLLWNSYTEAVAPVAAWRRISSGE